MYFVNDFFMIVQESTANPAWVLQGAWTEYEHVIKNSVMRKVPPRCYVPGISLTLCIVD